ncbi:MAG: type II toxin-antitoxin system VapC family toxin [Pseudomonadota bacterium]
MFVLDTSALIKRYVPERGATQVAELLDVAPSINVSRLACIEFAVFLSRSIQNRTFGTTEILAIRDLYNSDFARAINVLALTDEIASDTEKAVARLRDLPLRAADALHIQTAVHFEAELFVTADKQQARAAEGMGLKTLLIDAG